MLSLSEIRAKFDLLLKEQRHVIEEMANSNCIIEAIQETRRILDLSIPDAAYVVNVLILRQK